MKVLTDERGLWEEIEVPDECEPAGEQAPAGMSTGGRTAESRATVESIPLSPYVDTAPLTEGAHLEIATVVLFGESHPNTKGWIYTLESMQPFVTAIMQGPGLPMFAGHQDPERVNYEFRPLVGAWTGAKIEGDVLMLRGIVTDETLSKFIRSGVVNSTSIWGFPTISTKGGKTYVTDYEPISNDVVPPRREGMEARITHVTGVTGEMSVV